MDLQPILNDCGLIVLTAAPVTGGDINAAWCLNTADKKYFLKVNNAQRYPGMFEKEAQGLVALEHQTQLKIPHLIKFGSAASYQYLLLEWLERGVAKKNCWQQFGAGLAMQHHRSAGFFGWEADNFIGSIVQPNQPHLSWPLFYANCRILPLAKELMDAGHFSKQDIHAAELFCKSLPQHFTAEPPALLHGDLWGGNYMISENGCAAIFDPAVYYGHREMDIGMTKLFGGFNQSFYDAYQEAYPLEKGWLQRLPVTQLYPLLVHAVLFGGHYISEARAIITRFR